MSLLFNLSYFFEAIKPMMIFVLIVSVILFLIYIKTKCEMFFAHIKSIAQDLRRIADEIELRK